MNIKTPRADKAISSTPIIAASANTVFFWLGPLVAATCGGKASGGRYAGEVGHEFADRVGASN
jgi:hypothetical protein